MKTAALFCQRQSQFLRKQQFTLGPWVTERPARVGFVPPDSADDYAMRSPEAETARAMLVRGRLGRNCSTVFLSLDHARNPNQLIRSKSRFVGVEMHFFARSLKFRPGRTLGVLL